MKLGTEVLYNILQGNCELCVQGGEVALIPVGS